MFRSLVSTFSFKKVLFVIYQYLNHLTNEFYFQKKHVKEANRQRDIFMAKTKHLKTNMQF